MAGLKINICFWYLDNSLADEIVAILSDGNYDPVYHVYRDIHLVREKLNNDGFDLIMSDFDLPDTLRKTIEQLHKESGENIPLIYLVGEKNEQRAAETLKKGVWDYILKSHFAKLVPTVYSSQKYGKVLKDSKAILREKQQQDELSRLLIEHTSDAVFIMNSDWEVLFASTLAAESLGLPVVSVEDTVKRLCSIILDINGSPHKEIISLLKKEVELSNQQYYAGIVMSDKFVKYGILQIKLVHSEILKEQLTIITFRDLTELRKVEKELSASESKYLSMFNVVQDGMILIDPVTFEIVENNPQVEKMFGFESSKPNKDNLDRLTSNGFGYDRESLRKAVKKLSGDSPVSYVYLSRRLDGTEFWTENTMTRFSTGEVEYIVLVIRDIDEQKIMDNSLKESREHFQNLAENSPDVIMRFDREYRHLYVNQTVESQIGIKVDQFINKTHAEMGMFPEDMVEFWEDALEAVFKSGNSNTVEFDISGGEDTVYFEWRIFPERNDSGEIETVLAIARDITATRIAAKSIKENEERLQLALEATSLGLWDWDLETNQVYYSPIWMKMLGYEPDELPQVLDTWQQLLHDDEREQVTELVNNAIINRDEGFETDFRMLCKDGDYKWIFSKGKAVQFDEEGNTKRLTGTHEDIALRKRNENIQKTLFNISNAVNTSKDLQDLYEKIREFLGLVVDTTNCFLAIYHEENNTLTLPFLRDEKDSFTEFPAGKSLTGFVISSGQAQLIDREREKELTKQGLIEPVGAPSVSWLGVPLKIQNKTIGVYAIQSYNEDVVYTREDVTILEFVSDQIAFAIERKRDQESIRENQEKQRRIFESSPDPIIVVDEQAKIIDFNSALSDEFNVRDEPIISQNIFHFISRDFWRKAISNFKKTWEEGYIKNLEFILHRADGTTFNAEIATGAIYKNSGEPESMVIMIKNIDERKEAEQNLLAAKEKAEEADRLKTAFLSNMSHEIRTPMNAIVGFSDLLTDTTIADEDRAEFISQINLGADNLMHLIDDIIDISKIEAGQVKVNKSEFDLYDLVGEQMVMFRQNLARLDKGHLDLRLNWQLPEEHILLYSDPFRLKQVITNLISNAIKFTDEGYIEFGIKRINDLLHFCVKDSGIGIAEEKQAIIFDRFRQGHNSKTRLYGGTGLGLAISRNIVHLLDGDIGVNSIAGEGAEFWFTLPAQLQEQKNEMKQEEKEELSTAWKGKRILVAEDDTSNFKLISESLKSTKVEIIWAKNGHEALEIFKNEAKALDLVLMDIHMPLVNGYECAREIKKMRPDIPVIAQTAYAMSGERELSLDAGCDDYLSKPIQVETLLKLIGSYMK